MDDKARSISFSRGKGKLTHTDRTLIADNVDKDRMKNNVILVNESLSEAYDKIFGEAQAKYNAKQKRKDRKIDDYFSKLFGVSADSKEADVVIHNKNNQQSFYEWVVGVGGSYDTALVDWVNDNGDSIQANPEAAQLAIKCLTEYITGDEEAGVLSYEERNPNFHLMKAIIHADEKTPHLHVDVIPFTDGYKTSMSRQQGIAKALEAMGYGTGETAIAEWQEAERKVFREICERHGFVIRDDEKSRGYTVLTKQYGKFHENELALEKQQTQIAANAQAIEQSKADREAEEQSAEQAKKQREADEQKSAELQSEVTELTAKKDSLEGEIETSAAKLSDIQKRTAQAEEELVRKQEIPPPPKKPFERKPTPPITISREEFISNSVNRDLGLFERKKQAKEVGAVYDEKMSAYYRDLALHEQYERDSAAYKEEYEMTLTVQKVAAQQARTSQEQAQTAASQKATAAELTERENCLAKAEKQVQAERASVDVIVEKRVQQALQKAQTFVEYGRTNARFNALFSKFIGNGESYDDKKLHHEQKQTAHDEQKQPSETPLPKKRPKQKGYDDI